MIKDTRKPGSSIDEEANISPGEDGSTPEPKRYTVNAPIAKIRVPANRLRDLQDYSGLAASMKRIGLLAPITITEAGILVSGRHRLEAAKALGWRTIPAFVVEDDELENRLVEIDENLRRHDLTVYEQAKHAEERERVLEALGARAQAKDGATLRDEPPATVAGVFLNLRDGKVRVLRWHPDEDGHDLLQMPRHLVALAWADTALVERIDSRYALDSVLPPSREVLEECAARDAAADDIGVAWDLFEEQLRTAYGDAFDDAFDNDEQDRRRETRRGHTGEETP